VQLQIGSTVNAYKRNAASSSTKFTSVTVTEVAGAYLSFTGATVQGYGSDVCIPWDSIDLVTLLADPQPDETQV